MIRIVNEVDFSGIENDDFGEDWVVNIPKECIVRATLLSLEEFLKYCDNIPLIDQLWWTSSKGYNKYYVAYIDGRSYYDDDGTVDNDCGVRPVLVINDQPLNINVGDKFDFGKHKFTIISSDLAICDDIIGKMCFREDYNAPDANAYEKSDVKKIVDNWFNKAYNEYKG